jgi:hypothetical protein
LPEGPTSNQHTRVHSSDVAVTSPTNDGPITWIAKATARIKKSSSVEFRPHDLRRTAATMMTQAKTPRFVVQRILNHSETGVTAVYDRYGYDDEKRTALDEWGRKVEAIVKGIRQEQRGGDHRRAEMTWTRCHYRTKNAFSRGASLDSAIRFQTRLRRASRPTTVKRSP